MRAFCRNVVLVVFTALLLTLTGCTLGSSVEELFTLPQLPSEYANLSATLESLRQQGYEYISPDAGSHLESVQMEDIDYDGRQEAVVFLRSTGNKGTLSIRIFDSHGGVFEELCAIDCEAERIASVDYRDVTGDGMEEMIVGWCMEDGTQELAIYNADRKGVALLQRRYVDYAITDLLDCGMPGILVLQGEGTEAATAAYLAWDSGILNTTVQCGVCNSLKEMERGAICSGRIIGRNAIFISGINDEDILTTDILTCRRDADNRMELSVTEVENLYCGLLPTDINDDGIMEFPVPITWNMEEQDMRLSWIQYTEDGEGTVVQRTFHCQSMGWYLVIPEEYAASLSTAAWETATGEQCVTFILNGEDVASIYTMTRDNREDRLQMGDRELLMRLPGTIYACELYDASASYGITVESLRRDFSLIEDSWGD